MPYPLAEFARATTTTVIAAIAAATSAAQDAAPPTTMDLPNAETVLAKVEAKLGDAEQRDAIKSLIAKGTVGGGGVGAGEFEELYLGERASYRVTFGAMEMTQGTDGDMCWSTDPAVGITVCDGVEAGPVRRMFAVGRRAPWRTIYASAKTAARVDLDGTPHLELHMTPKTGKPEKWFVDPAAGVVSRVDMALPDPLGGEIACEFSFADWRAVDGLLFPFKKTQKVGTYNIAYEYSSIEPNATLTAAQVAPSAKVLAAAEKPANASARVPAEKGAFGTETATEQPTVTVRLKIKMADIAETLAVVLPEVMVHLRKAGVSPSGPPFSRYHSIDGDTCDLEAGMPVAEAVAGSGRVKASTLPAGTVAVTWHFGPFENLPDSYNALEEWMAAAKLTSRGGYWEVYWTDPGIEPDSSKWRTQVVWPVKK
ncbi:MAG: GyrI-like domain-containing protein [Planctomycetota bacterium]